MMSPMVNLGGSSGAAATPSMGPATPSPLTPMTPHSADPNIVPQLQ
jgi:transcription initiation factor TFIID TATA-box-binding protein